MCWFLIFFFYAVHGFFCNASGDTTRSVLSYSANDSCWGIEAEVWWTGKRSLAQCNYLVRFLPHVQRTVHFHCELPLAGVNKVIFGRPVVTPGLAFVGQMDVGGAH